MSNIFLAKQSYWQLGKLSFFPIVEDIVGSDTGYVYVGHPPLYIMFPETTKSPQISLLCKEGSESSRLGTYFCTL